MTLEADIIGIDDEHDWIWTTRPERALWRAVLLRALDDTNHRDPEIRQDALSFINGPRLDAVLELAGFDRDLALRPRVNLPPRRVRPPREGYALEYQGEVHSLYQWAKIFGIGRGVIYRRYRQGLPAEQVLSTELSRRGRKKRRPMEPPLC